MKQLKQSSKIALGGMVTALSVVMMLISIIPSMTYVAPALAGALLTLIVVEMGKKWAFFVYIAVSLLALLITPDRAAAVMYAMLFGYYPIVKAALESRLPRWAEWVLKLLLFNAATVVSYFVTVYVFGIPMDDMGGGGAVMLLLSLAGGNVAFFLYDFILTRLLTLYLNGWRRHFKRIFK